MKVGILGSGDVGKTLASGFLKHGHEVIIGTRTPDKLAAWKQKNPLGRVSNFDDAAKSGELIVLAVKGSAAEQVVSLVGTALSQQFGQQLIPTLINFGSLISQGGPKDLNIFSNLLKGVAYVAGTVGIQFEKMGMFLGKLGAQAIALVHGDLAGVSAIQKDWENDLARLNKQADELWDKLSRPLPEQADEGNTGGGKDIQDKEDEASLLTRLEAALAQKKAIYAQDAANRGEIAEFSKQQEMQFWDEALAHETLTKQQRATIEQKIATVRVSKLADVVDYFVSRMN